MKTIAFTHRVILMLLIALPFGLKAQKDTTSKKWSLGVSFNTLGNTTQYNTPYFYYGNPYYYYYYPQYYSVYGYSGASSSSNNSFSFSLKANFYLKQNTSLKLALGMKSFNMTSTFSDTGGSLANEQVQEVQRNIFATVGCQQDFNITKFFKIYAGLDFSVGYITTFTQTATNTELNYAYSPVTYSETLTLPAGAYFGLGPVAGFSFNLGKKFAVGADVTQALLYQVISGNETTTSTQTGNGSSSHSSSYKQNGWSNSGNIISINLLYVH